MKLKQWQMVVLMVLTAACVFCWELSSLWMKERRAIPGLKGGRVTPQMLAEMEKKYGGLVDVLVAKKYGVGPGRLQGGDRFSGTLHDYSTAYAEYLNLLLEHPVESMSVAEIGILKGSGVAIWTELFPKAIVHAFDWNITGFESNRAFLRAQGMDDSRIRLLQLNQKEDNTEVLLGVFGSKRLSFVIDDGCHSTICAWLTWHSFQPYLAPRFVYMIEDNGASEDLRSEILGMSSSFKVEARGELTIISRF